MKLYRSKGIPGIKNKIMISGGPNNHCNINYLSTGTETIGEHVRVCCQQH